MNARERSETVSWLQAQGVQLPDGAWMLDDEVEAAVQKWREAGSPTPAVVRCSNRPNGNGRDYTVTPAVSAEPQQPVIFTLD